MLGHSGQSLLLDLSHETTPAKLLPDCSCRTTHAINVMFVCLNFLKALTQFSFISFHEEKKRAVFVDAQSNSWRGVIIVWLA
jgi:hypothetical protein